MTQTKYVRPANRKFARCEPEKAAKPLTISRALAEEINARHHQGHALSDEATAFLSASFDTVAATRDAIFDDLTAILDTADREGRDLLASERRKYDDGMFILDTLTPLLAGGPAGDPPPGVWSGEAGDDDYQRNRPLDSSQTFGAYVRARELGPQMEHHADQPNLGKYLRGALTGNWGGAERELEISNAMSGASSPAGGILIPTLLSAEIIDLARKKTRVFQAGARLVPMESRTVDIAKWTQDPTLGWRAENDVVAESDAALGKITLQARNLATVVRVSRELVEDTNITEELVAAFAAALAGTIDTAALYGAGTANAPTGVKAHANVIKTPLGANGAALTSWDPLVDSVGRLRDANEEPAAQILADRTARSLAKLKAAGSGEYLAPPVYLDGVTRLTTTGVPTNLTVGTSNDCSDIFTGDWSQLYVGVRTNLQITLLSERYMTNDAAAADPEGGQYGFMAWWRGDIQVARPAAFDVVTGVRP